MDHLIGGNGNDFYLIGNQINDVIKEEVNGGIDTVRTGVSYNLPANVENLTLFSNTPAIGKGNNLNNTIQGNINGNKLFGNNGNDTLQGLGGHDILLGGNGEDFLVGGFGNDTLIGGLGSDSYIFNSTDEGLDTIDGYSVTDDEILIRQNGKGFGAGRLSSGTLSANQFIVGSSATNSNQRFIFDSINDLLLYDSDGNGASAAVKLVSFSNNINLTRFDIIII